MWSAALLLGANELSPNLERRKFTHIPAPLREPASRSPGSKLKCFGGWGCGPLTFSQVHKHIGDIHSRDVLADWIIAAPMVNAHKAVNSSICGNLGSSLGHLAQRV